MNKSLILKKKLKNAEGKRLLAKNKLEYCKIIIESIQQNPEIIDEILEELEITESDFLSYISGEKTANITFYDQTLNLIKEKTHTK